MSFIYTKQFTKDRRRLPKPIQIKLLERLELLLKNPSNPLLNIHSLNTPWEGYKSINISGDIRLVYKQEKFSYRLVRVGSHSTLYR